MARGNGQTDGGASAYDAAQRRKHHVEQALVPWPEGCRGCDYTGRREVAEHTRTDPPCVKVHLCACGCARGKARTERQAVPAFFDVRAAIEARFNLAIVDPTPRQRTPGGHLPLVIPKCGEYVPRNAGRARHLLTPVRSPEEARAWLANPTGRYADFVMPTEAEVAAGPPAPMAALEEPTAPAAELVPAPPVTAPPIAPAAPPAPPAPAVTPEPPPWVLDTSERPPWEDDPPPFPLDDDAPPFPPDDDAQPWR